VGAFSGVENAKTWGSSPEMPKTGSPLANGELGPSSNLNSGAQVIRRAAPVRARVCLVLVICIVRQIIIYLFCVGSRSPLHAKGDPIFQVL
jgi:hypothetical protein